MPGGKRREARRLAFVAMYAMECTGYSATETRALLATLKPDWADLPDFTVQLITRTEEHRLDLDKQLRTILQHWKLERVATVERALLKLACAEIDYFPEVPPRVTLNEYIELAKLYGDTKSAGFINGVLDRIVHTRQKPDVQIKPSRKSPAQAPRQGSGTS